MQQLSLRRSISSNPNAAVAPWAFFYEELQTQASANGLSSSGSKAELIDRLCKHGLSVVPPGTSAESAAGSGPRTDRCGSDPPTIADWNRFPLDKLQRIAKRCDLSTTGKKEDIIARLLANRVKLTGSISSDFAQPAPRAAELANAGSSFRRPCELRCNCRLVIGVVGLACLLALLFASFAVCRPWPLGCLGPRPSHVERKITTTSTEAIEQTTAYFEHAQLAPADQPNVQKQLARLVPDYFQHPCINAPTLMESKAWLFVGKNFSQMEETVLYMERALNNMPMSLRPSANTHWKVEHLDPSNSHDFQSCINRNHAEAGLYSIFVVDLRLLGESRTSKALDNILTPMLNLCQHVSAEGTNRALFVFLTDREYDWVYEQYSYYRHLDKAHLPVPDDSWLKLFSNAMRNKFEWGPHLRLRRRFVGYVLFVQCERCSEIGFFNQGIESESARARERY